MITNDEKDIMDFICRKCKGCKNLDFGVDFVQTREKCPHIVSALKKYRSGTNSCTEDNCVDCPFVIKEGGDEFFEYCAISGEVF